MIGEIVRKANSAHDVSEILVNCKFKQPIHATVPSDNKISIFLLNVQTLTNKFSHLRENINFYEKFDTFLFRETNYIVKTCLME